MSRLQQVFLVTLFIYIAICDFGECVHVILGDSAVFPETENCPNGAELSREEPYRTRLVAAREHGVWKPTEDYTDRVNQSASFAFTRTVYTDTGLFLLKCGSRERRIQLDVLIGVEASVSEGEPATLKCYYPDKHDDSVLRWTKDKEMVLELNLSSGEVKHGPGFKSRMSLSQAGSKHVDRSLVFDQVLQGDRGDYFCSVHRNGLREKWGDPGAVRLKWTERDPDQTSPRPPPASAAEEEQMGTLTIVFITSVVVFLIVAPLFFLLGWCVKSHCSRASPRSGGGQHSEVVKLMDSDSPLPPPCSLCLCKAFITLCFYSSTFIATNLP
ncbi:uncharacterized protein LOC115005822 [Cottoperca gobio]|uniref:Uncharacterized protein LOC115005822 n=1 Tax=Cottoperca gobio TaxID=56716 RepID=A0A6J2PEG7_COTGO|nr:uncharacterized protein LOC115005822 [Cottoperca gobio]